MYTNAELTSAIEELENGKHTIQNVIKLASLYTVRNNMDGNDIPLIRYSGDTEPVKDDCVGLYGDSDFLRLVHGKKCDEMWLMMNEIMDSVYMLNPRLYNSIMRKIETKDG